MYNHYNSIGMCLSLQNERFDAACSYIKFDRRRVKHHHQTVVSYRLALFLRRQEGVTFPNSSRCNLIRKFLKTKLKMLFVSLPTTVSKRYRLLQFKNIFLNKVLHIFLVPLVVFAVGQRTRSPIGLHLVFCKVVQDTYKTSPV